MATVTAAVADADAITADAPPLVHVLRGELVESVHRGWAVAVDVHGRTVLSVGADASVAPVVYPRSALKPFQAISFVEAAAEESGCDDAEIALACASHNGEEFHTAAVDGWLTRLGFAADDLACGPAWPMHKASANALVAAGKKPTRVHHNCSGKHAAMLSLAKQLGAPTAGYDEHEHPTQLAWLQVLSELIDADATALPWTRDGCGLPAIAMPLSGLAKAFAGYAAAAGEGGAGATGKLPPGRAKAMRRILRAVRAHPRMVAGSGRCCTAVLEATGGRVFAKTGAEGVYGGVVPHLGVGFALKIADGATRAAEVALGAVLRKLGALSGLDEDARGRLRGFFAPEIRNSQGVVTGRVEAVGWE